MSFIYFPQNTFTFIPNYAFLQTYPSTMTNIINPYPQQYSRLAQWKTYFHPQKSQVEIKQPSISTLRTSNDCEESKVLISTENNKNQQKKQKKPLKTQHIIRKQKQTSSAKKNSQSNLINQFYSYLSSQQRSQMLIRKAIRKTLPETQFQQKILLLFYNTIKLINIKRGRKYVNKNMMLNFFTPDVMVENLPEIKDLFLDCDFASIDDLCQIFRRACNSFIIQISPSAILTSKRITGNSKEQHFKKRRIILKSLMGY